MLLTELRRASGELHKSLEGHPLMADMMKGEGKEAFTAFLRAFSHLLPIAERASRRFLSPEEQSLFPYENWIRLLDDDLKALGSQRLSADEKVIDSPGFCWGFLYVLEGSALGSAELARRFASSGLPLSYLQRSEDRLRWPRFCKFLNEKSQLLSSEDAVSGALWGFQTMLAHFNAAKPVT